jgi:glycosyltransferase involved in cell wall biosynthesis
MTVKVALVHEWLTVIGGSEKVFKEITLLFPGADIYTLVAKKETIATLCLDQHHITTSFIQKLPFAKTKYRFYLPLFAFAIEQFDLSEYDLIISSSHAVAKGVLVNSNQIHVCYCHSPIRYAWDMHYQYLKGAGLNKGLKGILVKYLLHRIRQWDIISSNRVDFFVANSEYISKRIKKIYNRESTVIYPNVAVEDFVPVKQKEDFYVTCSRFVPYKKINVIVEAFSYMPDKKLIIIGDGPDFKKIKKMATSNVVLMGYQPFDVLKHYLSKAKAFVFAAEEDFGIISVEAQASGTPVIAFGKGGSTETVINNKTGVFFYKQTAISIIEAIIYFEQNIQKFDHNEIAEHASLFSTLRFRHEFKLYLEGVIKNRQ